MNRKRRNAVLLCAAAMLLALLTLAGCSLLDPLLNPNTEVHAGDDDEHDTRFAKGETYRGTDGETRIEQVTDENGEQVTDENGEAVTKIVPADENTGAAEAETDDPYRELTDKEREDLVELYNQVVKPTGLLLVGGWGTPNGALRDKKDSEGTAFEKAFDALAEAGFNCVVTADEWKSPEALAASLSCARSRQMTLWYNCGGQSSDNTVAKLLDLLKSRDSDALGAVVITTPDSTEDPSAVDLPDFLQYLDELRTGLNTDKMKLTVRLRPSYADYKGSAAYDLTYTQYVQNYIKGQGLDYTLVSYDAFPADGANRIAGLIGSLKAARTGGLAVYPVLQCAGSSTLREPTLEELRLSVHVSLAMGCKGYFFNGICGRTDSTETGILDADGNRTSMYNLVRTVNAEINGMREIFMSFSYISATAVNFPEAAEALGTGSESYYGALTEVTEANGGALLIGNFNSKNSRYSYYVVNTDTTKNAGVTLTLNEKRQVITWGDDGCEYANRTDTVTLELKPGEGMFVFTSPLGNES